MNENKSEKDGESRAYHFPAARVDQIPGAVAHNAWDLNNYNIYDKSMTVIKNSI